MSAQGPRGIERIIKATVYSWQGLKATFRNEAAFRQELLLCVILAPLGLWLGHNGVERALLVGSLLLVIIVELLNTGGTEAEYFNVDATSIHFLETLFSQFSHLVIDFEAAG